MTLTIKVQKFEILVNYFWNKTTGPNLHWSTPNSVKTQLLGPL